MPDAFQPAAAARKPARSPCRRAAWRRAALSCLVLTAASLPVAAAAGSAGTATPPTAAPTLRVASKSFTESVILGEITAQLLRANGLNARHQSGFGGTRLVWDALVGGAIDIYPEYTGTIVQEILFGTTPPSPAAGAAAPAGPALTAAAVSGIPPWLREALAAKGIGVLGPLGFNNSYAIGATSNTAQRLGLRTISDLRQHPALRFGFSNEFMSRKDGWPALRDRYGLPQTQVNGLDHDLAYRGLASGALDVIDLYATDPEIQQYGLRVLADDLRLFPRYDAVLLYRQDAAWANGITALSRLIGRIDESTMRSLNARVKTGREPEQAVAAAFLGATLGVSSRAAGERAGIGRRIADRAAEHLLLVGISLLAAILLAVPLGIVAARFPRAGQVVLAAAGIIQTIPSLALLVFMIPLFGIGALPATVALFFYSLLPIVRNTHAGLRNIPPSTRESAEALGLPPRAILWLIELPMAMPLILAGIKSAAVINVGTATLGALIGAGGFGQPIFTGIRLDDLGLILQGAVPASLLALLVQGLFELLERLLVPRGLRLRAR